MHIQLQPQSGNLDQWVSFARSEGYEFEIADLFSAPVLASPDLVEPLIDGYRQTGLTRSVHGAFIDVNPASADLLMRELSRRRCRESCRQAVSLGAEHVVFHSSCFPALRGGYLDNWASVCAAFYEELIHEYPVSIYLENAQDLDTAPLCALMERISSGRIGVCLDIGHAQYSRAPLPQWFADLKDRIGYLHLSDNMGAFDDHLPLGQGIIDWAAADRLWKSLEKHIPITLETGTLAQTRASLDYLKQNQYFGL